MIKDYKKIDLLGKPMIQKVILQPPFEFNFPVSDNACFLFSLDGDIVFHVNESNMAVPGNYSLFLNCLQTGKKITNSANSTRNEILIISFHAEILKMIYEKEVPLLLQPAVRVISNQSSETINNDFLIKKYIEGLLFYLENPSLVNDEILILKLKEILLLLSQTPNAETVQVILSQLFSPATYTFKQVIDANLFSQAGIEELARKVNLSVSSFKREFAKLYNDSPASYIKTKRLERAATLLVSSDHRITDIAFECGFNDLANFSKSFQDKYKTTPTAYRLDRISKKLN